MITSPPAAALKKAVPSALSSSTMNCEPAMNGVAITTSSEVVKLAHTSSGSRQQDIPGALIGMIVTRKLRAVMIDDAPAHWTPWFKKIAPIGWWLEQRVA